MRIVPGVGPPVAVNVVIVNVWRKAAAIPSRLDVAVVSDESRTVEEVGVAKTVTKLCTASDPATRAQTTRRHRPKRAVDPERSERKVYLKHLGNNFWEKLDARLAKIRNVVDGDTKIIRAFRQTLTEDRSTHGAKTHDLDDNTVDGFQQRVDRLIDLGSVDATTTAYAHTAC
ncbi:hypothetical protein K438DRAFT_1993662 [Mycena galopus ATCC 62051]|nr:hypothetical protein K438DRAFT_1993662 [Mycena galopus ATCC 62051]